MTRVGAEDFVPVVVITGASSGIGLATALEFADEGMRLVLASRGEEGLDAAVAQCRARGAEAIGVPTDVADNDRVEALATAAFDQFGRIDTWVNAAATALFSLIDESPLEDFHRVLDVNIMGVVHGTHEALRVMSLQQHGTIINIASVLGEVPQPYSAAYGMSKAAVRAFGASLRQELNTTGRHGVSVVTILPATIDTPFFSHAANYTGRQLLAMPPVYPPELVARAIVRAARRPRAEVYVGGLGRMLALQHRVMPWFAEAEMAALVEVAQLSPREGAPSTSGNLYEPSAPLGVTGGWSGAERTRARSLAGGWSGAERTRARSLAGVIVLAGAAVVGTVALGVRFAARR